MTLRLIVDIRRFHNGVRELKIRQNATVYLDILTRNFPTFDLILLRQIVKMQLLGIKIQMQIYKEFEPIMDPLDLN